MELRDPIHGNLEFNPNEVEVLETPAFQRLRSIKQLGFGEFSYPGATHNRFLHSLGVCHLSGEAFDGIFRGFPFQNKDTKWRLRQTVRLGSLLHDVGHGPLSHASEEVMPMLTDLKISCYDKNELDQNRQANHEDYTIKILTDSHLSDVLRKNFPDITPYHIACLIDRNLKVEDDFFVDGDKDLRPILCQLISSELDVDRMDYLLRDSHFCGTNYGKVELTWLIANLTHHQVDDRIHLGLDRKALYTFDDFLISRHHMYLMVYFHYKAIIYDEMLIKFLTSDDCGFLLPADIEEYIQFTDYYLYEHMKSSNNRWAQRISNRKPFKRIFELHVDQESDLTEKIKTQLEKENVSTILSSSIARLSKYHTSLHQDSNNRIYVVDRTQATPPFALEKATKIFQMYEDIRRIERLYIEPEKIELGQKILDKFKSH